MRGELLLIGFFVLSCCPPAKDWPNSKLGASHERAKRVRTADNARGAGKGRDIGKESRGARDRKQIHDVFAMGIYRVDLISKKGLCYAEIYSSGDPAVGPNLVIPLEMMKPCFVRRRVLCIPPRASSSQRNCASPLGSAHTYRHKVGSSDFLVTMLIGEPMSPLEENHLRPANPLRCGKQWIYFGVQNGVFSVGKPKKSESGICALKVYVEHMQKWGVDEKYVGGKKFKLPKRPGGSVSHGEQGVEVSPMQVRRVR